MIYLQDCLRGRGGLSLFCPDRRGWGGGLGARLMIKYVCVREESVQVKGRLRLRCVLEY